MIDEEKFTAAVQDQIKLVKAETKIFASKIVDMHVDFAQKNAPELIGQVTNLQQAKDELAEEILEALGYDDFETEVKEALKEHKNARL